MDFLKRNAGIIATIALIVAVVAIIGHSSQKFGNAVSPSYPSQATTNLPSFGLNFLQLGNGCDQQYTTCPQKVTTLRTPFTTTEGTTTLCAAQNPFNATTTVTMGSIDIQTATTAAYALSMGTSTDQYTVKTTMLNGIVIASSTKGTASPTYFPKSGDGIVGPTQWVTAGIVSSASSGYLFQNMVTGSSTTTPAGACNFNFQTVN